MRYRSNHMKNDQRTVIFGATQSGKKFRNLFFFLLIGTFVSVFLRTGKKKMVVRIFKQLDVH